MDTTMFARQHRRGAVEERLRHGAHRRPGRAEDDGAFQIHDWAYGGLPPNDTANVLEPPLRNIFTAFTSPARS